jgi:hypothetical protein
MSGLGPIRLYFLQMLFYNRSITLSSNGLAHNNKLGCYWTWLSIFQKLESRTACHDLSLAVNYFSITCTLFQNSWFSIFALRALLLPIFSKPEPILRISYLQLQRQRWSKLERFKSRPFFSKRAGKHTRDVVKMYSAGVVTRDRRMGYIQVNYFLETFQEQVQRFIHIRSWRMTSFSLSIDEVHMYVHKHTYNL